MTDPDRELARKARRGDRQALVELYERHGSRLLGFLIRRVGDRQRAEEIFQEVWIKVMERIESYRTEPGTFRSWLFRIAGNTAVDRARRETLRGGPSLDAPTGDAGAPAGELIAAPDPGPERLITGRLFLGELNRELASLSDAQRSAVLMRHQQGMSYAEISSALAIPEGTAKTMVHRGVKTLRARLKEWSDD